MLRQIASVISLISCLTACSAQQEKPAPPDNAAPNIIFILVDDMGWADVGYHGSEIATPTIDALAAQGVRLERTYAYPICSPTRAALMTGLNPISFGIDGPMENDAQLPADLTLLPQRLKEAGYQTWLTGKWHLGMGKFAAMPQARGFEEFYGHLGGFIDFYTHVYFGGLDWQRNGTSLREEGYSTDLVTTAAVDLIEERGGNGQPFFLYLAYNAPHTPLQYPPGSQDGYSEIADSDRRVYAQMLTYLDESINEVLQSLKDQGLYDNTLIIFQSDNGGMIEGGARNVPLRGGKGMALEGGVRVPAFAVWPAALKAGHINTVPIFTQDWAPTLLEAVGAPFDKSDFDGISVWPSIVGDKPVQRLKPVLLGTAVSKAVYEWPYKLVRTKVPGEQGTQQVNTQLYDVLVDPTESNDISAQHPERVAQLSAVIDTLPPTPSKAARGPKPETLFRDETGQFIYDIRKPEMREPWAEAALQ